MITHWAIFTDNNSHKKDFIDSILKGVNPHFEQLNTKKGALFSPISLYKFIDEEERHEHKFLVNSNQPLKSLSSGEQKKALLYYIIKSNPDYIILDNPFDNLDIDFQQELKVMFLKYSNQICFVQLVSRKDDLLPFITNFGTLKQHVFTNQIDSKNTEGNKDENSKIILSGPIPKALETIEIKDDILVKFKDVSVAYGNKKIVNHIDWTVKKREFWQLIGKNGSGKTTLLSMITGDNPKGYGQDLFLFGQKKGTGESVWDIKKKLGYFTPAMTDKFTGRHSVENMLISGLTDSIGLYIKPTEAQLKIIKEWLMLVGLWDKRNALFREISLGQKRLIMTVRAMVKHPPLLILDEPTTGMDDISARILVALTNKIAKETQTTIIFVSHRKEPGLEPKKIFELKTTQQGSYGSIQNL
ncbi:ATP-binding cassette domain-containing protein [Maribacter sp. CXY002]|uniref:ATP-binding cassette domain-containing protein n=1 Tax=Maribacter luteocoastalis TaxID=3407671 RepID=UPI003B6788E2